MWGGLVAGEVQEAGAGLGEVLHVVDAHEGLGNLGLSHCVTPLGVAAPYDEWNYEHDKNNISYAGA
jgi:hypothetical protein